MSHFHRASKATNAVYSSARGEVGSGSVVPVVETVQAAAITNRIKEANVSFIAGDTTATRSDQHGIPGSPPNARILVADSDQAVTALLARALIEEGYYVDVVHDGRDALSQVEQSPYDIVLLDHFLPGLLGIEVLHRWANSSLPGKVVIMSSSPDSSSVVLSLDTGATDFISKPFDVSILLARVRAHLRPRHLVTLP